MKVMEWVSKKLTIQFFVQISSRCNWQSPNKLVKLNSAILEQKNDSNIRGCLYEVGSRAENTGMFQQS